MQVLTRRRLPVVGLLALLSVTGSGCAPESIQTFPGPRRPVGQLIELRDSYGGPILYSVDGRAGPFKWAGRSESVTITEHRYNRIPDGKFTVTLEPGEHVLEVGCAYGSQSRAIQVYFRGEAGSSYKLECLVNRSSGKFEVHFEPREK
jgi:hypothetical protein